MKTKICSHFIPKFFDGISNVQDACTQKQVDTNNVFYLVMLCEIKSCEKYNSWQRPSSKKGQRGLHFQLNSDLQFYGTKYGK